MNDNSIYPHLHPFAGATAYAFHNITSIYRSTPDFRANRAVFTWEENEFEERKFDLTYLLAHEFMHNLQYNHNRIYYYRTTIGKRNWKLEGHAEYISRGFKNDCALMDKIAVFQRESAKDHVGIPVFELEDGTVQSLGYFQYALVVQYLMEIKAMNFDEVCDLRADFNDLYTEMLDWSEQVQG